MSRLKHFEKKNVVVCYRIFCDILFLCFRSMLNLVKYIHHDTRLNSLDNSELFTSKESVWYSLLKNTVKDLKPTNSEALCKHFENG